MPVNLSGKQFQDAALEETVTRIIKDTGIDPKLLKIDRPFVKDITVDTDDPAILYPALSDQAFQKKRRSWSAVLCVK